MAKVSARGCYALAETAVGEWRDISDGRNDHFARTQMILRSDGMVLEKSSFKKTYSYGPAAHSSHTRIVTGIEKGIPQSEWLEIFTTYIAYRKRRGMSLGAVKELG